MKDQGMSNQNLIQHSITKSRFEKKNIKRHSKECDLHGFKKLVKIIKKMLPVVHFHPNLHLI